MNPDMSDALMGMEDPAGDAPSMFDEGEAGGDVGIELGAGDETELDELFAADAQALFPDFDDDQLTSLQKLIDARIDQKYGTPEAEMEAPAAELPEGDLGL